MLARMLPDGGDGIQVGLVNGAPDLGQIGRQRGQTREISPTGLAHSAGARTGQSVEPFRLERLPADTVLSQPRIGRGKQGCNHAGTAGTTLVPVL
jgi:hypothetical protein